MTATEDEFLKTQFLSKYKETGEYKFYQFLLAYSMQKLVEIEKKQYTGIYPNVELLNFHDKFIKIYRKEGDEVYLDIAKFFRKAGHKVYRIMLKKNMIQKDKKFLTLV